MLRLSFSRTVRHPAVQYAEYFVPDVISKKIFHLPIFSMEASWYLAYKVSESDGGVGISRNRNHRCIKYFNSLRIESCSTETTMSYLRILSKSSLEKLRKLLGAGVGLGLARK